SVPVPRSERARECREMDSAAVALSPAGHASGRDRRWMCTHMKTTVQTTSCSASTTQGQRKQAEIAYVLKGFPRTSETFITNEIHLLETLGLDLAIFSVKRLEDQKLHGNVSRIQAPVTYLPEAEPVNESPFLNWLWRTLPRFLSSHRFVF